MRRFLLASAAVLVLPAAARAADAADDSAPVIIVTADRDAGYRIGATGTATRTDTPLLDVPQSVEILGRQRLDDQAILSIADALRYVPGATTAQGEGHRDQIVLRGNSSTADFFVDGLRDDVQYYRDFYNIERLEILKGPNAMVFGRGGGGGIVNRVSKTPLSEAFVAGDASVDTFGAWRLGADLGAPVAGDLAARVAAVYEDGANHRDSYDFQRWAVNPTLRLDLGRGQIILGYEHAEDHRVVDRGVPSRDGKPVQGYRDAFFGDAAVNRSAFNADIVSLAADYALTDSLTIRNRSRYGDYDKFYRNLFPASAVVGNGFTVSAYEDGTQRQNLLSQTDLVWKVATGPLAHTLLAGFEFGRQVTRSQRLNGFFAGNQLTAPVLLDGFVAPPVVFRPGTGQRDARTRADIYSGFVQDQITIGRIELVAGLRYDSFRLDYTNNLNGQALTRTDRLWSPRLGLIFKPAANASLYASFGRSYLPQSGDQFTSLDATTAALEPEKFDNYEVGAKWDINPALNLTAALYRLDRSNTRAAGPVAGTVVLSGAQRSEGFELALNGRLLPNWQASAGFAIQNAELRSATTAGPAGRSVALVPDVQASLWTRYDLSQRFGLGLGVTHQGKSFANISNAVVLPAYTRVDAALFVALTRQLEAQVNVENVFDTGYFPTANSDNNVSTGGPRAARFTLRAKY